MRQHGGGAGDVMIGFAVVLAIAQLGIKHVYLVIAGMDRAIGRNQQRPVDHLPVTAIRVEE